MSHSPSQPPHLDASPPPLDSPRDACEPPDDWDADLGEFDLDALLLDDEPPPEPRDFGWLDEPDDS